MKIEFKLSHQNYLFFLLILLLSLPINLLGQYNGTASVTQGLATTIASNLYTCSGGRVTHLGMITASDKSVWIVPAEVNFTKTSFPFASDLYNSCIGANYTNASQALAALNGNDIVSIDSNGEVITAFIFADNYFEMYVNGIPVGKDKVPYTQFNSSIVRFKVKRPFTIAMLLVDWEENLGLGSELSGNFAYHDGDGGMVAVFMDSNNKIIAKTSSDWKAQTFYTSPITNLSCPTENGSLRHSDQCSTQDVNDGKAFYALHWIKPQEWMQASFDDASWPNAMTFSNSVIGVNNKPAYTNFTNIFDDPKNDALFIWSSNLILDNEVVVRFTVPGTTFIHEQYIKPFHFYVYPNPVHNDLHIKTSSFINMDSFRNILLINVQGEEVFTSDRFVNSISLNGIPQGVYWLKIKFKYAEYIERVIIQ